MGAGGAVVGGGGCGLAERERVEVVKVVFVNSQGTKVIDVKMQSVCEPRGQRRWVGFVVDLRRAKMAELAVTWFAWIVAAVFVVEVALHFDEPTNRSFELKERDADETAWQLCDQYMKVPVEGLRRGELVPKDVVNEDDLVVVLVVMTAEISVRRVSVVLALVELAGGN